MEEKKKKRLFNYRPMCVVAVSLMAGIIVGEFFYGVNPLLRLIPFFLFASLFAAFMCVKHIRRFSYIFVMLLVGFLGLCGSSDIYAKNTKIDEYEGYIYGRVSSQITVESGRTYFYIEDVYAGDQKLEYDAYVSVSHEEIPEYNAGDIVKIIGTLKANRHKKFDSFHAYDVAKRDGFTVYSSVDVEKIAEGEMQLLERLPYKIKSNFYERMDDSSAAICTALVLGDKSGIDDDMYDNISVSGLSHVLAVSGLHIAVISAVLFFVFRKMKIKPKIALFLVFGLMLFYCFLCDFTASSLRALIMMTILNFSVAFGRKRDTLSTIAFSAIIILIFRPTALMEAGFLMSYGAVLGIALFYGKFLSVGMKLVNKISPKKHLGKHVAEAVALSLSANLVAFPFIAYFFRRVTILFVLSNILVLPYLMFIYLLLLIISVFSLVVGWSGALVIFKYLLIPFKGYVTIFGSLKFVSIPVAMTPIGIFGLMILFVFLSKYIFARRMTKVVGGVTVASITLVLALVSMYADRLSEQNSSGIKQGETIEAAHVAAACEQIQPETCKEAEYVSQSFCVDFAPKF